LFSIIQQGHHAAVHRVVELDTYVLALNAHRFLSNAGLAYRDRYDQKETPFHHHVFDQAHSSLAGQAYFSRALVAIRHTCGPNRCTVNVKMSLTEMRIGDQTIRYDREATVAAYGGLAHGFAEECGSIFCQNFAAQRKSGLSGFVSGTA
jgi:hypothetical protein